MATLTDILVTAQNIAQAIGTVGQTYANVQGTQNLPLIAAATLVKPSAGRVCTVSVTTAGSVGAIYDANVATATTRQIYVIPAAVGLYVVNLPTTYGIVVAPGSSQVLTVSFS